MKRSLPYLCGLDAAIDIIGGKWKALILWEMQDAPRRFGELKRGLPGISEKMLIQQLRELEGDGIVHREMYHQIPPKVEYSLTELGVSLNEALGPLGDWGELHMSKIEAAHRCTPVESGAVEPHHSSRGFMMRFHERRP